MLIEKEKSKWYWVTVNVKAGKHTVILDVKNRQKYRLRHPGKAECERVFRRALANGFIRRGPCEICGTILNVEGHHPDYRSPLKIKWLCRMHHKELHTNGITK